MVKKLRKSRSTKFIAVVLSVVLLTLTTAAAFSEPQLSIQYHNNWETMETQFRNVLTSDAPAGYLDFMQVNMTVCEYNSYVSGTVLYDGMNSDENPTDDWISVSCVFRGLPVGTYLNSGVGIIKYRDNIYSGERQVVSEASDFVHNPSISTRAETFTNQEIEEKTAHYKLRGVNQSALFGGISDEYRCFLDSEMINADNTGIDLWGYLTIKQSLCLCYGDTIPTYFVSPDKDIVFVVKQDSNGNVFRFKFSKNDDGEFILVELLDQFAEAEHINNAMAIYSSETPVTQAVSGYILEKYPLGWDWCTDNEARSHFDSALNYLMVRDQIELTYGDTSVVYLFSADEKEVVVLKEDIYGVTYRYNFSKDLSGEWNLDSSGIN